MKQLAVSEAQGNAQKVQLENHKLQSEIVLNMAKAQAQENASEAESMKIQMEVQKLFAQLQEVQELGRQNDAALLNAQANYIKATRGGETDGSKS